MRKTLLLLFWTLLGIYAIFLLISPCAWAIYDLSPQVWYRIRDSSILYQIPLTAAEIQLVRLLVWYREKRSLRTLGWGSRPVLGISIIGLVIGVAAYLCVVAVNLLVGWERIVGVVHPVWYRTVIGLGLAFLVALGEETVFRGYLFTRLEALQGTLPALILSTLAFSLFHLFGTDPIGAWRSGHGEQFLLFAVLTLIQKGVIGVLFAAAYLVRRQFWMAVGCHCGWDWLAFLFGYEPQSAIVRLKYTASVFVPSGIGTWTNYLFPTLIFVVLLLWAKRNGQWRLRPGGTDLKEPTDASPPIESSPRTAQPLTAEGPTLTLKLGPQPYLSELLRGLGYWAVVVVFALVMMASSPHDIPLGITFLSIPFAVFVFMSLSSLLGTCTIRLDRDTNGITINGRNVAALSEIEKVTMDYGWGYGMLRFRVFLVLETGRKILVAESPRLRSRPQTFTQVAVYRQLGTQEEELFDGSGDWQSKLAALGEDDTFRHFKEIHNQIQRFLE